MSERIWTAGLLVIGDEILSGRTQDRNISPIATWLNLQGIRLAGDESGRSQLLAHQGVIKHPGVGAVRDHSSAPRR